MARMCDEELLVQYMNGQFEYLKTLYYRGLMSAKEYREALEDLLFFLRKMKRRMGV